MGEKLFRTWEKKEREKERKYVITMAKLRMAHASTHGARKPPGPIEYDLAVCIISPPSVCPFTITLGQKIYMG